MGIIKYLGFYFLFIILIGFNNSGFAQNPDTKTKTKDKKETETKISPELVSISIRDVGVNLGYYKPVMTDWSDSPVTWIEKGVSYTNKSAFLEANLNSSIGARVEFGIWEHSYYKPITNFGSNSLDYKIMPFTIGFFYNILPDAPITLLAGIGGGVNFVTVKYGVEPTVGIDTYQQIKGQDMIYYLQTECEFPIFDHNFTIGFEAKYMLGNYFQDFEFNKVAMQQKISLNGFAFGIKFKHIL